MRMVTVEDKDGIVDVDVEFDMVGVKAGSLVSRPTICELKTMAVPELLVLDSSKDLRCGH
jgi:hypothetical protein